MLRLMDNLWIDHLTMMESMRRGIGLQAAAQRDPLVAYKREGHSLFQGLLENIRQDVVRTIYRVSIARQQAPQRVVAGRAPVAAGVAGSSSGSGAIRPLRNTDRKVGRNDPCPCGSGKKYKKCCGR